MYLRNKKGESENISITCTFIALDTIFRVKAVLLKTALGQFPYS